ncbi:MAG: hypothetical protein ACI9KE_000209 [Polyangiales bacterium]|jgi:hypothetical protein
MKSLVMFVFVAAGLGCGAATPVPDYPFTDPLPLEETDLAQFVGGDEDYEEEEEEEWDDGLDDADMEMNNDSAGEAPPAADAPES